MKQITLVAPTGNLGSSFSEESFLSALERKPDMIACDSGSTDGGPYRLGSGVPYFPRPLYKRDLKVILKGAHAHKVPVIIGSAAGAGLNCQVDFLVDVAREIAAEENLAFDAACVYSDQSKEYLTKRLQEGRIRALPPSEELTQETLDRAANVVGMMGVEPLIEALDRGATLIIAGRSSDTALFAALPIKRGFNPGPAWHAGKILECGAASTVQRLFPDSMIAAVDDDGFTIGPTNPAMRCSPLSVAAHTLYENGDPFVMREPSGTLDTTACAYEAVDDRIVRVSGSTFHPADQYTVKLEAAELIGYRSFSISGVRDPMILSDLDLFLGEVRERTYAKVLDTAGVGPDCYQLNFRCYGLDGAMGPLEQEKTIGHEIGLMIEAVAETQDLASIVASYGRYLALHNPVRHWTGMVTNLAVPMSPPVINHGPVYQFTMNHVVIPDSPTEMFRVEELTI
jgi:hypothetical protein